MIVDRPHLILDNILDLRTMGVGNTAQRKFFVRWKNALEESSSETKESLWRWKKEIVEYDVELVRTTGLLRTTTTHGEGGCQGPESISSPSGESGAQHGHV